MAVAHCANSWITQLTLMTKFRRWPLLLHSGRHTACAVDGSGQRLPRCTCVLHPSIPALSPASLSPCRPVAPSPRLPEGPGQQCLPPPGRSQRKTTRRGPVIGIAEATSAVLLPAMRHAGDARHARIRAPRIAGDSEAAKGRLRLYAANKVMHICGYAGMRLAGMRVCGYAECRDAGMRLRALNNKGRRSTGASVERVPACFIDKANLGATPRAGQPTGHGGSWAVGGEL